MSKKEKKESSIWRLLGYIKSYKGLVAGNMISNILTSLFSLLSIPLLMTLLDILLSGKEESVDFPQQLTNFAEFKQYLFAYFLQFSDENGHQTAMLYLCLFFMVTIFLTTFFRYLSLYFMAPVRQGIVKDLRNNVFKKMLHLPLSFFGEERKGDLMSRLTSDVQEVEWSILNMLEAVFRNPIMIIGALSFMIFVSPELTLFVFGLMAFAILLITRITKSLKKSSSKAQELLGYLISIIEEGLGGLRIIKSFSAEEYQLKKFNKVNQDYNDLHVKILRKRDLASPFSEFLGVTAMLILLYYGSGQVMNGTMAGSSFLAYLLAFYNLINPSKALSNAYSNIQKGRAALDRLDAIIDTENSILSHPDSKSIKTIHDSIIIEDICFKYTDTTEKVLDHVNLEIKKGQTIAFVGESGSGKSTIVDLIPRFYDIQSGSIKIDGTDIRDIRLVDLRKLFGIVSQDPVLFHDTILNNITFGEETDLDKVKAVAKMAHAHDFIEQSENGYETIIGDRGMKLSGGQRQRLTIARALYKNPEVLIFDEATSALDSESERLVQAALASVTKNRTSIIIAHRLSTIQKADWIVVLDKGRIAEQGTHDNLMDLNHHYAKLVRMQRL